MGVGLVIWAALAKPCACGLSNYVLQWSARKRVSHRALNMARAPTEHSVRLPSDGKLVVGDNRMEG